MFRSVCLAVMTALVAACATPPAKPVALPASFWQEQGAKIGVVLAEFPKGGVQMVGPQDALDSDRQCGRCSPLNYMQTLQPSEFHQLGQSFSERLRAKGYSVAVIPERFERAQYVLLQTKGSRRLDDPSITLMRTKYGVDRLLLLSIDRFGALRDYFVFVPTAAPLAMFQVSGELIDLTRNEVLWQVSMAEKQNLIAIEGGWDESPDYPNLTQAIRRAEHDAVVYLQSAFFGGADVRLDRAR